MSEFYGVQIMEPDQQNIKPELDREAIILLENLPQSSADIDYQPLETLLAAGDWHNANVLTRELILGIVNRQKFWLRDKDIQRLPSADLEIVDRLWQAYSNGQFGFTIQSQILQECYEKNRSPRYSLNFEGAVEDFGTHVGWSVDSERRRPGFSNYKWFFDGITIDESSPPPRGHFPRTYEFGGGKIIARKYYEADYDDAVQGILMSSGHFYNERENDYFLGMDFLSAFFKKFQDVESS
ncbi:GUN4 domain-containing protein [[Leptolyngbya] sp. PCC 7376]|uniref:GUN4 domain-containing protein n=1 Tax=[Leptolyngbya] sp. PCC 7376 TaxID=111781 RepID=UPI00135A824D|nr:GUN4 domain-containing protein [[Leptolyngbya] sp. PCC 7376]